jgi:hypothetical protein
LATPSAETPRVVLFTDTIIKFLIVDASLCL